MKTDVAGASSYELADRYTAGRRPVLLTGVQAVARWLVEQHARDARAGLDTASLISGYPGSPLAGLDKTLAGVPELRERHGVHLVSGLNEELAATAVWGSQSELPQKGSARRPDGVIGVWYGKGPGVDRSGDVFRHANLYGAHRHGGALVLAGDDPGSKSSTVPCVSERSLAALGIPVLYPRNAEEIVRFGLYGTALSRASGCWVGLKIVADVADGLFTVDADFAAQDIVVPPLVWEGRPWTYRQRVLAVPADSLLAEEDLFGPRWEMVEAFRDANSAEPIKQASSIDRVEVDPAHAWLGIAATGAQYDAVRQALLDLGLDETALHHHGIRLLRIGMPFPLGGRVLRQFARGLDEILVVEEKTSFVEGQVRDLLYGTPSAPRVLGKLDRAGRRLVPATGALTAARLVPALRDVLGGKVDLPSAAPAPARRRSLPLTATKRIPYFCSGCPHNRSTVLPEGSLGGGGIGCHTMVTIAPRESAQVTGLTQMGGEGAQWIGQAPFTDVPHIFQNIGDGTYFHSGQLAIQACVAAGVNLTYKILFNQVVAMTGAQDPKGALEVPALTRKLHAEGVKEIIVCAEEPDRYGRHAVFAPGTEVWPRDRLDEAQRRLRDVPGVTVLIYDQQCAAEARRLRKRGHLAPRRTRVVINEAVCEGCGDCGVQSNCLSVQPVETELGRKTRIDQTSCNTDYSCLHGDCPSFLTVTAPAGGRAPKRTTPTAPPVPDPTLPAVAGTYDVFLAGIGGTGIVTVNALLATAAIHEGLHCSGLDQTGLSQKAGPVTSHLRLSTEAGNGPANRLSPGSADAVLAFDLVVATEPANLTLSNVDRTVAVASTSRTPTGAMVYDPAVSYPEGDAMLADVRANSHRTYAFDALAAAESLFGSVEVANLIVVGAAYQAGALPLSAASLERAIEQNGVAVAANQAAFQWGRVAIADPDAFAAAQHPTSTATRRADNAYVARSLAGRALDGETRRLVAIRAVAMRDHSGKSAARRYVDLVEAAWQAEQALGERHGFSEAVARQAHRLGAYKDEYEVARLLTDPELEAQALAAVPGATGLTYHLHPPALRSAGMKEKLKLGPSMRPVLKLLAQGRRLRGTPLDPFGLATMRRIERALVADYTDTVTRLAGTLDPASYDRAVAIADAAELVRGYEGIKLASVQRYRERREELGQPLSAKLLALLDSAKST